MALSEEHAKWAREAGEAFAAAEENADSMLVTVGKSLRDFFINDEDLIEKGLYKPLRAAFKKSYLATGKNEANVSANWSRILYQHAWPGVKRAAGKWYKLDDEGNSVPDKERSKKTLKKAATSPTIEGGEIAGGGSDLLKEQCIQFVRLLGKKAKVDFIDLLVFPDAIEDIAEVLSSRLEEFFDEKGFFDE